MALVLLVAGAGTAAAQSSNVTGTVTGATGEPMIGVMVVVQGTQTVSMTDVEGRYAIEAPSSESVLSFSLAGYTAVTRTVGTQSVIDVVMAEEAQNIDQVVVTALGILRKEKSLTYATQIVDGDELSRVKDANMMNSLAGKTAGVQINRSSAGVGGSAKVVIRGSRSLNGVGGPLYVIDGVPVGGGGSGTNTFDSYGDYRGGHDTGDNISQLNPEDIESMNVLKGPSAAALYGTSAANGVILITTKKGAAGRTNISFSTNTMFDDAVYGRPEFQDSYGGGSTSWGNKITQKSDYLKDYFKTGVTTINSLSLSGGNDRAQTYFSYSNTLAKGVVRGNELNKHNISFRETASFLNDRLKLDANINMMYQRMENLISPGGYYMNPLVGLYLFPRGGKVDRDGGIPFEYYRDQYEVYDAGRNLMTQNWYMSTIENQNPFWLNRRTPSDSRRYRTLTNLSISYKINNDLSIQARGKADFTASNFEKKLYAGVYPGLASTADGTNGFYGVSENMGLSLYGDLLLTWQHNWENWSASATLGGSISDGHGRSMGVDSNSSGLKYPNLFNVNNINTPARPSAGKWRGSQDQAVFFAGQVGWKEQLFLDVTARNDWTSTLAYTKSMKSGFFYPSVGLSWLIDQTVEMPEWVTMGKVRATWAQVGNGLPGGSTNPKHGVGFGPNIGFNTTAPYGDLKPEMTTSVEYGTEWRLFNGRLEFDVTYYLTHSRNQAFNIGAPTGSYYTRLWVQTGDLRNEGVEITLAGTPVRTQEFTWRTGFNYASNRNTVVQLLGKQYDDEKGVWEERLSFFQIGNGNGGNGYNMRAYPGGTMGDIYGYAFKRDGVDEAVDADGNTILVPNHTGAIQFDPETRLPLVENKENQKKLGNANADFTLGWQNTLTWKGVSLYMLIDGRFGGEVVSMTQADLDLAGVSKRTGDDRARGYVELEGHKIEGNEKIQAFYALVGGRGGVTEHYVYSGTNIRLRELSIGYSLPRRWMEKTGWIKGVDVSLIGRNLGFLLNRAPYDPDALMSTGMSLQGVDVYGLPSLRSYGFNVKLNF